MWVDQFFMQGGKGKSACNGDSGGPLVCQGEDSKWYQVENWAKDSYKSKQIVIVLKANKSG